ncbi:MAG: sigma-70 family RNA polymerase sigma factor [Longimicrobiales bacterium]|nr:sigma-70 family RNA polymerase sigma factor [Longimicrobiales bacterium]
MTEASDEALVRRARGGDAEAYGLLVERYQGRMLAYARHMGFAPADAEDLVQEGFVRGFRNLGRCGDPSRFDGWLFRIVSNLLRSAVRRRGRRPVVHDQEVLGRIPSSLPGPEERAEGEWTRERVREALDGLPADQREALVLLYLEGRSVSEISEWTGASPSAVKMRLKRGRDALRVALAPCFEEEVE